MKTFAIGLVCAALAGCVSAPAPRHDYIPSETEAAAADYGPYPDGYESIVRAHLDMALKDAPTARIIFGDPPTKTYRTRGPRPSDVRYFWYVTAKINAKNSYGGYTGFRTYWFHLRDGRVVESGDYGASS